MVLGVPIFKHFRVVFVTKYKTSRENRHLMTKYKFYLDRGYFCKIEGQRNPDFFIPIFYNQVSGSKILPIFCLINLMINFCFRMKDVQV